MVFSDGREQSRIVLCADENGVPGLDLYDQNDNIRASLSVGENGEPRLEILKEDGESGIILDLDEDEEIAKEN